MKISYRLTLISALVLLTIAACKQQPEIPTQQVNLTMISHLAGGMSEQDVFIADGDGGVMRIVGDDFDPDQMIYAAAEKVPHNLFGLGDNPLGSFAMGDALDMTMGDWLGASGQGVYSLTGDDAEFTFTFADLVPNATYTLWCGRTILPPHAVGNDLPCGDGSGTDNLFETDAAGGATVSMELLKLPDTSAETVTFIAVAWHSDGQTYGAYPGDFGFNSHVQLFSVIPPFDDAAWENMAEVASR